MKKSGLLLLLVVLVVAALVSAAQWRYEVDEISFDTAPVRVSVVQGDHLRSIGRKLREAGMHVPDWSLALVGRWRNDLTRIKVGTYEFAPPVTLKALVDQIVDGDVLTSEVRVIEGWTFARMRQAIVDHPDLVPASANMTDKEMLTSIGAPFEAPEGLFFPSTYHFPVGATDLDVYRQAYELMQKNLQDAWAARQPNLPLKSPHEALILASIVEKETGLEADRQHVAGVFINRLRINMRLQSDPTTIYGLGDSFDGNLRRRDLRADTPFNTYTRAGLPPTPISLPGRASLDAVLNPADTKALYFVARGDGSSQFSDTLSEHQSAVRKFQLNR